ncbi:MAG TPA: transglycosylase SLT domain-containing protein, partial [Candidatus Acidoferrales bacterium]|nr:transglycosylase SLT domain-containing protein [Candidatus Acidoferrales bacterium]
MPSLSSLALRFLVVMVVVAAVATLLRLRSQPSSAGLQPVAVALAAEPAPPAPKPVWHLGFNGWLIRVDNADVAIPSLAEQIQARRQARLAWTVSPFDDLIIHHSDAHGFDWRLVAALIFEESKFDPDSESDRGAVGLMQVRPVAAEAVGEASSKDPDDNIRTGVSYLHQLDDMFADVGDDDRMCLVLAAYNIGPGHVHD